MDKAVEQLNLACIGLSDLLAWFFEITYESGRAIKVASDNGTPVSLLLPAHKHITCSDQLDNAFDNYACAIREILTIFVDLPYLVYSLLIELLFKSFINPEQKVLITLQRYDGISFPRNIQLTCEYRNSSKYDLTAKECRCDPGFGTFRKVVMQPGYPFGKPYYDPYCGQPNLQVQLFNKVERIVEYITSDMFSNVREILNAIVRLILEPIRLALKQY